MTRAQWNDRSLTERVQLLKNCDPTMKHFPQLIALMAAKRYDELTSLQRNMVSELRTAGKPATCGLCGLAWNRCKGHGRGTK